MHLSGWNASLGFQDRKLCSIKPRILYILDQTLIIAILHGCLQVLSLLLILKTYTKECWELFFEGYSSSYEKILEKSGKYSIHIERKKGKNQCNKFFQIFLCFGIN